MIDKYLQKHSDCLNCVAFKSCSFNTGNILCDEFRHENGDINEKVSDMVVEIENAIGKNDEVINTLITSTARQVKSFDVDVQIVYDTYLELCKRHTAYLFTAEQVYRLEQFWVYKASNDLNVKYIADHYGLNFKYINGCYEVKLVQKRSDEYTIEQAS